MPDFSCNICGKELEDGENAYGTTIGHIDEDYGLGFVAAEFEPWLTIACEVCGHHISTCISNLMLRGGDEDAEFTTSS